MGLFSTFHTVFRGARLRSKLYAACVGIVLGTALIIGWFVQMQTQAHALDEISQSLRTKASMLRALAMPALAGSSDAGFQERVAALGQESAVRLTVIRADGVVIGDSEENPARMEN